MNDPKGCVAKVACPTFEAMGQIPAFHRTYFLFVLPFVSCYSTMSRNKLRVTQPVTATVTVKMSLRSKELRLEKSEHLATNSMIRSMMTTNGTGQKGRPRPNQFPVSNMPNDNGQTDRRTA